MPFLISEKPKSIGIFGAGQLARMLALRAREMGLEVNLLTENKKDPAVAFCHYWYPKTFEDTRTLKRFLESQDVVTFESEFVPAELLKRLPSHLQKKIFPQVNNLARLQDRWPQKELLLDFDIHTAPFIKINSKDDFDQLFHLFPDGFVLKKRFGGYDGYGTFVVKTRAQMSLLRKMLKGSEQNFIAEKRILFKSEKSLVFARSQNGNFVHYPLFESFQKNNQCFQVWGPSKHPAEKRMIRKISELLSAINYVGVIAFELFDTGQELLVNEIAPRVHNTGHITLSAFSVSQFDLHLRCLLGMPLPKPQALASHYLMQNLIGSRTISPRISKQLQGQLFWYEKTENRKLRKMGHINYVGKNLSELKSQASRDLKEIKL